MKGTQGLYDPRFEHDGCGVGFVARVDGTPSREVIDRGFEVLRNLLHRGAIGGDLETGDGAGLLIQVPDAFLRRECAGQGIALPPAGRYGVGMVFLPRSEAGRRAGRAALEQALAAEGLTAAGWREVPVDGRVPGEKARRDMPVIEQCFVTGGPAEAEALERRLYVARKRAERAMRTAAAPDAGAFYVASLSCRTVVYKGMMTGGQLPDFYADLRDPALTAAIAIIHERYSTNTFPSWPLAQPFRFLGHNGEINTLRGNRNAMRSRERSLESDLFGTEIQALLPIIEAEGSDSACLDNVVELLVRAGRTPAHAMLMLIPQAWGARYPMGPDLRGFFEYHAGLMEPWDGPAAVAFSDGRYVGALLDRNGLRPARYTITRDGLAVFGSEAGIVDVPPEAVAERGALRPGQMLLVDTARGHVLEDAEIKMQLARRQPYRRWVQENRISIHGLFNAVAPVTPAEADALLRSERLFGYTREDRNVILGPMAATGKEPVGSMGADYPLAVLSEQPQLLYNYFKQLFAQITNPAIDPIREELVMSLMTYLGTSPRILSEVPQHARLVKLRHPFLSNEDLERIRSLHLDDFRCQALPIGFPARGSGRDLEEALEQLCRMGEAAAAGGVRFLVLSDRGLPEHQAPIPALLAVSALNQHLVRKGLRTPVSLLMETGEAR
ncbi:MAG: glutamate synthase subunit alpha, partial [Lentisphaerae bacterium]|nr:glutamate synthase subunit alpha [Lentisphaerota bacterium]